MKPKRKRAVTSGTLVRRSLRRETTSEHKKRMLGKRIREQNASLASGWNRKRQPGPGEDVCMVCGVSLMGSQYHLDDSRTRHGWCADLENKVLKRPDLAVKVLKRLK